MKIAITITGLLYSVLLNAAELTILLILHANPPTFPNLQK